MFQEGGGIASVYHLSTFFFFEFFYSLGIGKYCEDKNLFNSLMTAFRSDTTAGFNLDA